MGRDGPVTGVYTGKRNYTELNTFQQGLVGIPNGGTIFFVDSARSASGRGDSWDQAFITIAEAVAASLAEGGHHDTILVKGTENEEDSGTLANDYDEAVIIAASQVGLRIIGMGNGPEGIAWNAAADSAVLTVYARDCYVANMRFRPVGATTGCGISLITSADMSTNPMGFTVENCIFRSTGTTALAGILIDGTNDVTIQNCKFTSVLTGVLMQATNHSVAYRMIIRNNLFDDKLTNGIIIDGRSCLIEGNHFAGASFTMILQTNGVGAAGSYNIVRNHFFDTATAYETNCSGTATDDWWFNYCDDTGSSTVSAAYLTIGIPTA